MGQIGVCGETIALKGMGMGQHERCEQMQRFLVLKSQLQSFSPTVHFVFVNTRSSLLSEPKGENSHVPGTVRSKVQAPHRHRHYCWLARLHKQGEQWSGGYLLSSCSRADTNQNVL